jgi:hypothetical protein
MNQKKVSKRDHAYDHEPADKRHPVPFGLKNIDA